MGFTLVEVLLVLVLLAILAAAVAPSVSTALAGGRLRTAARELAAAERFARSMSLLIQSPIDLQLDLEEGRFAVIAQERESVSRFGMSDLAALTNEVGYTEELLYTSSKRTASLSGGFGIAVSEEDYEDGVLTNALERLQEQFGSNVVDTVSMADSINFKRTADQIAFRFEGWRDTPSSRRSNDADWSGEQEQGSVTIRFHANGTVRPHRIAVIDQKNPEDVLYVSVNGVGRARVQTEQELE